MLLIFLYYRMNLCTTVTESDVARAKNALKASLVGQLNGNKLKLTHTQIWCKEREYIDYVFSTDSVVF